MVAINRNDFWFLLTNRMQLGRVSLAPYQTQPKQKKKKFQAYIVPTSSTVCSYLKASIHFWVSSNYIGVLLLSQFLYHGLFCVPVFLFHLSLDSSRWWSIRIVTIVVTVVALKTFFIIMVGLVWTVVIIAVAKKKKLCKATNDLSGFAQLELVSVARSSWVCNTPQRKKC